MQDTKRFSPDDPLLTAYALNELEGDERAVVEAALRYDPAAREQVAEIRATASQLTAALADELEDVPTGKFIPMPREATGAGRIPANAGEAMPKQPPTGSGQRGVLRFPQLYYVIGLAAAACFAVIFVLHSSREDSPAMVPKTAIVAKPIVPPAAVTEKSPEAPATLIMVTKENEAVATTRTETKPASEAAAPVIHVESTVADTAKPVDTAATANVTSPVIAVAVESPAPSAAPASGAPVIVAPKTAVATTDSAKASPIPATPAVRQPAPRPKLADILAKNPSPTAAVPLPDPAESKSPVLTAQGEAKARQLSSQDDIVTLSPFVVDSGPRQNFLKRLFAGLGPDRPAPRQREDALPAPPAPRAAVFGALRDYTYGRDNDFVRAVDTPLSTFALNVDTESYDSVRRYVQLHRRPPVDAVRIEELVNYFPYHYAAPTGDVAFSAALEVAYAPWAPTHRLVRIGLKGREVAATARPPANLVFLLDASGSMNEPNKLPLVKESLRQLVSRLRSDDRVAIVTYAGTSGLALPSTPAADTKAIVNALNRIEAGGDTTGSPGIQLAYDIAKANFVAGGTNRVILCTDGDFGLGTAQPAELVRLVEEKAKSGLSLTALGFGLARSKDNLLELLADKGNGDYGYIDTRREAERFFVEQINSSLTTIAKDVKIQVDFNPALVASYRLLGYENRRLNPRDFNHDKADASEIGAGHAVTALYEVVLVGTDQVAVSELASPDESKYVTTVRPELKDGAATKELLTVRVRYKAPENDALCKQEFPLPDTNAVFAQATPDFRFAVAVAGYGMVMRNSPYKGTATIANVTEWAVAAASDDPGGYRGEFIGLVRDSEKLVDTY